MIAELLNKAKEIGDGISTAFQGAGSGISTVISSARGEIPPEMIGELNKIEAVASAELRKLELQVDIKMAELTADVQKEAYTFALKYEGDATQVPKWVLLLRTLIRPVITILTMLSFFLFVGIDSFAIIRGNEAVVLVSLPQPYWWIVGIVVTFWFGGKVGENIIDKFKSN